MLKKRYPEKRHILYRFIWKSPPGTNGFLICCYSILNWSISVIYNKGVPSSSFTIDKKAWIRASSVFIEQMKSARL